MSKLYVFGIGGTGARVLRSLTMLLASGVDCKFDTIVPIIIDPDISGANITDAVNFLEAYTDVIRELDQNGQRANKFFKTKIEKVAKQGNFTIQLLDTQDKTFEKYIQFNQLSEANRALVSMLFSKQNLESDMQEGFKGNPNIGSVVLNQFSTSQAYKDFANSFEEGDRIFIISSIFGGTGASGFPLLLKTFREDTTSQNFKLINGSMIGAITVLPYFQVKQDDKSEIDSSTFYSKTKSALSYYEKNISGNNSIDALYYVGDSRTATYDNHEGGPEQRNDAHLIEFISAMSILHFASLPDIDPTQNRQTQAYEFGVNNPNDANQLTLENLGKETYNAVANPLLQFLLFCKYAEKSIDHDEEQNHQPWAIDNDLDKDFFSGNFYKDVKNIQNGFINWLRELDSNSRSFKPFNEEENDLSKLIINKKDRRLKRLTYEKMDKTLNKQGVVLSDSLGQKFLELFYKATSDIVNK